MKKILLAVAVLGLVAFTATGAQAEDKYVAGGFEAAGNIVTGMGYQHFTKNWGTGTAALPVPGTYENAFDGDTVTTAGTMGKYLGTASAAYSDHFSFFVDSVELDLMKSFGENIRMRADLDFGRVASSGAGTAAFTLEQAYGTANIPLGNGIEFLIGRFNTPIGFEAYDVVDNDTISKSILARALRPSNTTGVKLYYAFSDLVDLHFYVVNTLYRDSDVKLTDVPSGGFRLGFNWGEEGTESTLGVSGIFGPESRVSNKNFTYGADLDLNWWLTESFALGAEALWTKSGHSTAAKHGVVTGDSMMYMAGLLNLHYVFSDVWDGTLKYTWAKQFGYVNGVPAGAWAIANMNTMNLIGLRESVQEFRLAGQYAIADGAKLKLEAGFDMLKPSALIKTAGGGSAYVYGGAVAFAYNF